MAVAELGIRSADHAFKRVLFVGAGFSAGLCYPVGASLTTRLVEYLQGGRKVPGIPEMGLPSSLSSRGLRAQREEIEKAVGTFLQRYFGLPIGSVGQVSVAEFFTLAHSLSESPSLFGFDEGHDDLPEVGPIHVRHLFNLLACVTRTYFLDICQSMERPADFEDVLDALDPQRDAIINFNWDEEVDIYLTGYSVGEVAYTSAAWSPPSKKEERYLLLRPHGSVGWYDITCGIGNRWTYLIANEDHRIPRSQKRIVAYSEVGWPRDLGSRKPFSKLACPPIITPPTFAKRFQYKEQHRIWRDVLEVCSRATEFVFLGYSLPADDYLTRAAICSSLTSQASEPTKCLVVGLDERVLENFKGVFGAGIQSDKHFLHWRFGCNKPGLAESIEKRLKRAVIDKPA